MAGKSLQPSHEPAFQALVTLMKQWKEPNNIRDGRGEDAKWTAPQTTAQMLNEELSDPSSVQIYHVPCEPALIGLTAGCPLSSLQSVEFIANWHLMNIKKKNILNSWPASVTFTEIPLVDQ